MWVSGIDFLVGNKLLLATEESCQPCFLVVFLVLLIPMLVYTCSPSTQGLRVCVPLLFHGVRCPMECF